MTAILKAIQDYLNNVGVLIFHIEYDNIDGQGEVEVLVDNMNPPVGDRELFLFKHKPVQLVIS